MSDTIDKINWYVVGSLFVILCFCILVAVNAGCVSGDFVIIKVERTKVPAVVTTTKPEEMGDVQTPSEIIDEVLNGSH